MKNRLAIFQGAGGRSNLTNVTGGVANVQFYNSVFNGNTNGVTFAGTATVNPAKFLIRVIAEATTVGSVTTTRYWFDGEPEQGAVTAPGTVAYELDMHAVLGVQEIDVSIPNTQGVGGVAMSMNGEATPVLTSMHLTWNPINYNQLTITFGPNDNYSFPVSAVAFDIGTTQAYTWYDSKPA